MTKSSIETGVKVIQDNLKQLPATPGVYRMIGEHDEVLYVGKAKSLKARVRSYTHFDKLGARIQRMVAQTRQMVFVHTHTEVEALLLESNLIKELKPRYNILLRDDKSFPYILLTGHHDFPQVKKHRGAKKPKGEYFGPFASAGNVNRTLAAASDEMDFEEAAMYRDRIRAMAAIQSKQDINVDGLKDADVVALSRQGGNSCIQVFFFRGGCNYGNRAYFPRHQSDESDADIMGAFLAQFYQHKPVPKQT